MSYKVFALKWRPQKFDDVIGQEHVTKTLKNAILSERVAHAYLFTGPRGVGKTSVARILAKSLNCLEGPTENPCNKCSNCVDITSGRSLDVLEIDGASNRRIDDIREIGENVRFAPSNSKYKIYIIDEVHMLTKEAFNALLKTLEEPPAHVKFIFATTEADKVIDTIVSRCQRFDFRRIDIEAIVGNLKNILEKEGESINEDILYDIARAADGGMRDAESLLDQVISYCDNDMDKAKVEAVLGLIGYESIAKLTESIFNKDAAGALAFIDDVVCQGKDIYVLLLNLITYLRELILIKLSKNDSLSSLTGSEKKQAQNLLTNLTTEKLMYAINLLVELEIKVKKHNMPRIPIEMAIIKLAHMSDLVSLKKILEKLEGGVEVEYEAKQVEVPRKVQEAQKYAGAAPQCSLSNETKNIAASGSPRRVTPTENLKTPAPTTHNIEHTTLNTDTPIETIWQNLMTRLKKTNMPLSVTLSRGVASQFDGHKLIITFSSQNEFYRDNIAQERNKNIIEKALTEMFGKEIKIECIINAELDVPITPKQEEVKPKVNNADLVAHPVVKKTVEMFGGRVVDIKEC